MESFNSIAYSKLKEDMGSVNTAEHLRYCATLPFTSLKADLRPTADGKVILCHDAGFTLDESGRITRYNKDDCKRILEMTEAECLALEHAQVFDGKHCKVCDFETYIQICKECGKKAFITVRNEDIETVASFVLPVLEKYDYINRSIINSFTVATLEIFRRRCPQIRMSNVLPLRKVMEKADVDTALRLGNCLLNCFHFTGSDPVGGMDIMKASAEAIAYALEKGVAVYQAQVSENITPEELMKYGISGAQMFYAPTQS